MTDRRLRGSKPIAEHQTSGSNALVMMGFGFLGVGALYEDIFLTVPYYPHEDHKLRATSFTSRVGGNIPNALNVLSQVAGSGDRLVFVSVFAERTVSQRLTDTLRKNGVEVHGVWRDCPENPRSWILKSEQTGSRTIINYSDTTEFTVDELVETVADVKSNVRGITWAHFEGRIPDVLRVAIPRIRKLLDCAIISVEFEKPDRPGLIDLLPLVDVAFFSHLYFAHFQSQRKDSNPSPSDFFSAMRKLNSSATMVLTAGAKGAYYSIPGEEGSVSAPRVQVVDATGAGDTFTAGFVWARNKLERPVKESVEFAVNLASQKVAQEGFDRVWDGFQ